jgi:hypothetical protein
MTIKAKSLIKDRFWIIEDEGQRIGTLSWTDERYMFTGLNETCFFDNRNQLKNKFGVNIVWLNDVEVKKSNKNHSVYGYPCNVEPFNIMYDVKRKLPLYSKSDKSKSLYCAGYFIIKFDKGWVKSFCPKLITIERYENKGPFKTELEMRQELNNANR